MGGESLSSSQNPFYSIFVLLIIEDEIVMGGPLKLHFILINEDKNYHYISKGTSHRYNLLIRHFFPVIRETMLTRR